MVCLVRSHGTSFCSLARMSRKFLAKQGHIISTFEFRKEWSEIDVEIEIRNAFEETLPSDVDFEIVYSVHTTLSRPILAPGQSLTGAVVSRVFKDSKPVYVRPCKQSLSVPNKVSYTISRSYFIEFVDPLVLLCTSQCNPPAARTTCNLCLVKVRNVSPPRGTFFIQ